VTWRAAAAAIRVLLFAFVGKWAFQSLTARFRQGLFRVIETNLCAIAQMDFETFAYMPDLPFDTGQKG